LAKQTGLGWTTLSVADSGGTARDIRTDINNLDFATPRAVFDVTGIDKSAHERLLGLADYSISMHGTWDNGTNLAHTVFSTVPSSSVVRAVTCVVNAATLSPNVYLTDYKITRAASGELTWDVPGALADGAVPTWS
jgi:hypothetical protein